MLTVQLSSPHDLKRKLNTILTVAKARESIHVIILTNMTFHMEVFDWFIKHSNISRLKLGEDTVFIIKEMRIEIKPINLFI